MAEIEGQYDVVQRQGYWYVVHKEEPRRPHSEDLNLAVECPFLDADQALVVMGALTVAFLSGQNFGIRTSNEAFGLLMMHQDERAQHGA